MLAEYPPAPGTVLQCDRCGLTFRTLLARYWYIVLGLRGRSMQGAPSPKPKGEPDRRLCLCGPCGDILDRTVELYMLARCKSTGIEGEIRLPVMTGNPE